MTDAAQLENPYKGLRAFAEADATDFFGREDLVQHLVERIAQEQASARFLAIVGPSGSGKSSAVRAGLVPALRRGALPGSERWFIVEIFPGAHPLEELEAALLRVAINPPDHLLTQLREDTRGLARAIKRTLPPDEQIELVLVIDQFEELWTQTVSAADRAHLLDSLREAVLDPRSRVRVVITLRADFIDRPLQHGAFGALLRERMELLLPLGQEELRQAIVKPAERVGLIVEPELVATIIHDVSAQPGTLPLLQYALTELFEWRLGRVLTLDAYQAAGRVTGALVRRAEATYDQLDDTGKAAAQQLFLRLVAVGDGIADTRRRVPLPELGTVGSEHITRLGETVGTKGLIPCIFQSFGRYRLLTFDHDPMSRAPTVEVAHEALIQQWGRLQHWIDESRAALLVHRRLAAEAAEWQRAGSEAGYLASGARLTQYQELLAQQTIALNHDERSFLDASLAERERLEAVEQAQQKRERLLQRHSTQRLRALVGALLLFLVVAGGLSIFAFRQRAQALQSLTFSEAQRLAAEASTLLQARDNAEVIALLSIRSMGIQYTPQGSTALAGAARLEYAQRVFIGHTGAVRSVAFSPDDRYVLTGSFDGSARLWDAETGAEIRCFEGHANEVFDVAFSPDGRYALTGSMDATARLWDVQSGQQLREFTGHTAGVWAVAFSPDSTYIATASDDHTARIWDTETGALIRQFDHPDLVMDVIFAPDGASLFTGGFDTVTRQWDIQSGTLLQTFNGHTLPVWNLAISSDGARLLTGSIDKTARLWDVQSSEELRRFIGHTDLLGGVAFSPDDRQVFTGSQDRSARLWDAETGQELRRFNGHSSLIWNVALSHDGHTALTAAFDGTVRLWNLESHPLASVFTGQSAGIHNVAFSPDGRAALSGGDDDSAQLWDVSTGQAIRSFTGHTLSVFAVAFSPDGKQVLTGSQDGLARLWDTQSGQELRSFESKTSLGITNVAFSPDGKQMLTADINATAVLWDVQTGQELHQFQHENNVYGVAFSPDGRFILTGGFDQTARLWDATTYEPIHVLKDTTGAGAASVAFSPDSTLIATGSWDGTVRLWNTQTGAEIRQFAGHSDAVWAIAFSTDGTYLISGSGDTTARLWDVQSGAELRRFAGHTGAVNGVAFAPTGGSVLTGSSDGTARLWDVDYQTTITALCDRLVRDFTDEERVQYGLSGETATCPHTGN